MRSRIIELTSPQWLSKTYSESGARLRADARRLDHSPNWSYASVTKHNVSYEFCSMPLNNAGYSMLPGNPCPLCN